MKKPFFAVTWCLFMVTATSSHASEWRGIVPLHSARKDVRKILGKPAAVYAHGHVEQYRVGDDWVEVEYAFAGCDLIGDGWGAFKVPAWTVQLVKVEFVERGIPLADFGVSGIEALERVPISSGDVQYFDRARGVAYTVREGKVIGIDYAPSTADNSLRCRAENSKDNL